MWEDTGQFVKNALKFAFGRGLGFILPVAATLTFAGISPVAFTVLPFVVFPLAFGVNAWVNYGNQKFEERKLLSHYRDEISTVLGVPKEQVTLEHLKAVAYGDDTLGVPGNAVIAQHLDRVGQRHWMKNINNLAATGVSMVTFFALPWLFSLGGNSPGATSTFVGAWLGLDAAALSKVGALGFASGFVTLGMGKIFDVVTSNVMGYAQPSVHEVIGGMRAQLAQGKAVQPEQVFALMVQADPGLAALVEQQFGQPYIALSAKQQHTATVQLGDTHQVAKIAELINSRQMQVDELAFLLVGQKSGTALAPARKLEADPSAVSVAIQNVSQAAGQVATHVAEQSRRFADKCMRKPEGQGFVESEQLRRASQDMAPVAVRA